MHLAVPELCLLSHQHPPSSKQELHLITLSGTAARACPLWGLPLPVCLLEITVPATQRVRQLSRMGCTSFSALQGEALPFLTVFPKENGCKQLHCPSVSPKEFLNPSASCSSATSASFVERSSFVKARNLSGLLWSQSL